MKKWTFITAMMAVMTMSATSALAQKQYYLPTGDTSADEKDNPMIEVYLPKEEVANGCAVVLCPGGAMRWLSWESDVVKMASFLNERGIAAIGLRYHLNKGEMPKGVNMPPMVDVTHPDQFPQADANPMHTAYGDSIILLAAKDAKAAIRMVREHAEEWHISKDKIGFLGFSAGGGVAIAATMSADNMERPNFLCTNFGPSLMPVTVPEDAPPLLIMTRADHPNVAAGLVALFMEWKKAGANAELHMYGDGKGPYELMPEMGETTTESWGAQMIQWLKAKGFYKCTAIEETQYQQVNDIPYTESNDAYAKERCKLDVYYPTDQNDAPVVVWFHGGGIEGGNKYIDEELKNSGLVVVAPNYRLLPQAHIDDILDDAAAAVAWTYKNIEKYGGSHRKIFVVGHSAGGYLLDMIGLEKKWLAKYGVDADSLAALVPFSGQCITHYNIRKQQGISPLQPTIDQYAPITFIRPDAPPVIIISGDRELELFGRYEEQAYFWRMLKLVGHQDVTLYEMQGYDHGAMPHPAYHILKQHIKRLTTASGQ